MNPTSNRAVYIALTSYFLWGFFPIYWKLLKALPAVEILAHRVLWSFVFYSFVYLYVRYRRGTARLPLTTRQIRLSILAAALIAMNWGIYIYGVNSGRVLETSLAYFLNPLMSVAVGVIFFKESFPWPLKLALTFAAAGILIQIGMASQFPWIALTLASSFCAYGVVKKVIAVEPSLGSAMEGAAGVVPALIAAIYLRSHSDVALTPYYVALLIGSGVVTGLPLYLFSVAAQSLPYSLLGMMQFVAPTLQFLVGYLVYQEPLDNTRLLAFTLIWVGVGFYLADRITRLSAEAYRKRR